MSLNVENSVLDRYSEGAKERQASLCCPVSYDAGLLAGLPAEIIEKDYGCGDPSPYVQTGDAVLDLGSGGGKICYMAAQLVGDKGSVTGVDMNDDMLALARKYQDEMAKKLGGDRVSFKKGNIQDLALGVDALAEYLQAYPVHCHADYVALRTWEAGQRKHEPLIQDESIDLVISNCVLNLVADHEKRQLVREIFRVLRPGGRVAIADIVSDRESPADMKADSELWSGCISGAFQETEFLDEFVAAGFHAVKYDKWDQEPWQVVGDIEFRSVTLTAVKPEMPSDQPDGQTLIYRGPFAAVTDEAGTCFTRGQRTTVSARTHSLLTSPAYQSAFIDVAERGATSQNSCCSPGDATLSEPSSDNGCCQG